MTNLQLRQIDLRIIDIVKHESPLGGIQIYRRYLSLWGSINWGFLLKRLKHLSHIDSLSAVTDSRGFINYSTGV